VCIVFMVSNILEKKNSSHCIYLFFLFDENTLSRLHLLIRCIRGAQNVVIVYEYIVGAMGSYVEHNRTTTTSTVCYSLCWPVSSPLLHLIFFSSLTPSSYQSNNISFMATFEQERSESR